MVFPLDLSPIRPSMLALIAPALSAQDCTEESEGPASAPTILVEVDEVGKLTSLPGPPPVPRIAGMDDWHLPPLPLPLLPELAIVRVARRFSRRPNARAPEQRSHEHPRARAIRPSHPPSLPPSAPVMRHAA